MTAAAARARHPDRHPMAGHMPPLTPDPYTHARPIRPTPETGAQIDRCTRALQAIWDAAATVASELADAETATGIRTSGDGTRSTPADSAPAVYHPDGTLICLDAPPLRGYDRAIANRIRRLAQRVEDLAADLAADTVRRHCHGCAAAAAEGSFHSAHAH